ncbi:sulfur carrier protein ThiS [Actinokineospora terrae]|uniref:Sulfur carrier protein n=1 Tax=Actinokineospora terrae TaxID=155974 RepID=A0A1H9UDS2_9PSEU|nr:sulfur carrier protein ThiS [Actinokineospora terrae]SES07317.1 sulfur carrier protein [Actinokineospora terrae]
MIVVVNGVERKLADGVTVGELLVVLGVSGAGIAVAVDGEVVPRAGHASTVVRAGAVVEVLTAVQGG